MADQPGVVSFDEAPVTMRYRLSVILFASTGVIDFFDFFVVGFLVSVLAPKWHLTFGQTSIMLMSAGIGAMLGALASGFLADRFGRKPLAVVGVLICGLSSGAIALIPDDGWILFAGLRFFVGFGLAGGAAAGVPAIVEFAPTRHRTLITSLVGVPVAFGVLSASITASYLLPMVGWRGLAAVGFLPIMLAVLTAVVMPESPRWLISKGRVREAQVSIRKLYRVGDQTFALPTLPAASPARFADLLTEQRRFWLTVLTWFGASTANYGVFLWGPTIVALLLGVAPQDAAKMFILVSLAGVLGRTGFAFLAHRVGRKPCGQLMGYGTAISLGLAASFHSDFVGSVPLFLVFLMVGALFFDGGFSSLAPYPAEIFPVQLGGRAVGLAQLANGIGKIAGPLCLALIAGSDNPVLPHATASAVLPAFIFLAGSGLLVGLAFTFLGVEPHGRPVSLFGGNRIGKATLEQATAETAA
ncbi:MFS transporter [Bradyrhizobium jicamae]|uniref:MFS transporter n=1 Tax=Bradyrhizobium jicamae TaxID=280332 RepID=A0ABS5FLE5_9BRAD|nr:MFS transporter [Bradyrhizobium jicamae]MBR0797613.1 MFS transporter [Bradyrhizobium jicamae]